MTIVPLVQVVFIVHSTGLAVVAAPDSPVKMDGQRPKENGRDVLDLTTNNCAGMCPAQVTAAGSKTPLVRR